MNLEFRSGRSDKAAKLHSILKGKVDHATGRDCDFWAERGERGRWVRIHNQPRTASFSSDEVPRGPGRKTRLRNSRVVHGVDVAGHHFSTTDDWRRTAPAASHLLRGRGRPSSWSTRFTMNVGGQTNDGNETRSPTLRRAGLRPQRRSCVGQTYPIPNKPTAPKDSIRQARFSQQSPSSALS